MYTSENRFEYYETRTDRVGDKNTNKFGSLMVVDEYNNANDIWVKFVEYGNRVHTSYNRFLKKVVRNPYDKSVYGVGFIGEGDYKPRVNGSDSPQYTSWHRMMERCYNPKWTEKQPSYIDCKVLEEWHNFQNFAVWYDENYYEIDDQRMELDKDIITKGNKIYSPENCVFVPHRINSLFIKSNTMRGKFPIGVVFNKRDSKFVATSKRGKGKKVHLGQYDTPEDAFLAYKTFKEILIKEVAEEYRGNIPDKLYKAMRSYKVQIID